MQRLYLFTFNSNEIMKLIGMGTYPMYHIEKVLERKFNKVANQIDYEKRNVTFSHTDKIEVGDSINYKFQDLTFVVTKINEEREARGNHNKPAMFYDLVLEFKR